MVLAELPGRVAKRLERRGKRTGLIRNTDISAGLADRRQARAERNLAGNEIGAAGRAACLRVIVGEDHPVGGELVEVWGLARHDSTVVGADIEPADIVAHDDEDIGLASRRGLLCLRNGSLNS